ncbi:MAG: hypothetical protein JNG90_05320 [Planctomycetaceae bacterium]|nr:hypothetical protein [Planctomycetaceae bacterium]
MARLISLFVMGLLLVAAGCDGQPKKKRPRTVPQQCPPGQPCPYQTVRLDEIPIVNPPPNSRFKNYAGGSCYHASIQQVMVMQGFGDEALEYRAKYAHAASTNTIADNLDREGFRFAYTDRGDVGFLEWCMRTRRAAAITYFPRHAVTLVHLDQQNAMLLDNNRVAQYITIPRDEFLHRWRHEFGGGAITVVYHPVPPLPL